ncbi:MAG: hypothetical protein AAF708_18305 [Deinococcota bacterium]
MSTTLRNSVLMLLVFYMAALTHAQTSEIEFVNYQYLDISFDMPLGWSSPVRDNGRLVISADENSLDPSFTLLVSTPIDTDLEPSEFLDWFVDNEFGISFDNKQLHQMSNSSTALMTANIYDLEDVTLNLVFSVQFDEIEKMTKIVTFAFSSVSSLDFDAVDFVLRVINSIQRTDAETTESAILIPSTDTLEESLNVSSTRILEGSWQPTLQGANDVIDRVQANSGTPPSEDRSTYLLGGERAGVRLEFHFRPEGIYLIDYRTPVPDATEDVTEHIIEVGAYTASDDSLILRPDYIERETYIGNQAQTESERQTNIPLREYAFTQDSHFMMLYGPYAPYQADNYCEDGTLFLTLNPIP